jgi:hypothetical protein
VSWSWSYTNRWSVSECMLASWPPIDVHLKIWRENVRRLLLKVTFPLTLGLVPPDHLLMDRSPNIGPLISRWEFNEFKNCWNKSFRTSKILRLLYQQFSNLLISQREMSGPRLGALANNRCLEGTYSSR